MREFKVAITYGEDRQTTKQYSFDTQAEKDAFFLGLDQCVGWYDYKLVGQNDDDPQFVSVALVLHCNGDEHSERGRYCTEYEEIQEGWTNRNLFRWVTKDEYRGDCFTYNLWDHDKQEDQWMCQRCQSTNVTVTEVAS